MLSYTGLSCSTMSLMRISELEKRVRQNATGPAALRCSAGFVGEVAVVGVENNAYRTDMLTSDNHWWTGMTVSTTPSAQLVDAAICDMPLNTLYLFVATPSRTPGHLTVVLSAHDTTREQFPFTVEVGATSTTASGLPGTTRPSALDTTIVPQRCSTCARGW